jgi:hypothetical protein
VRSLVSGIPQSQSSKATTNHVPDDAGREDLDILRERYRIRSVIDLRGM